MVHVSNPLKDVEKLDFSSMGIKKHPIESRVAVIWKNQ